MTKRIKKKCCNKYLKPNGKRCKNCVDPNYKKDAKTN